MSQKWRAAVSGKRRCLFTDAVFAFQAQKQEETGAVKDDTLELKAWNKRTKNYEDDTEVNSQINCWASFLSRFHVLGCSGDVMIN